MTRSRTDAPFVQIPQTGDDRPAWVKVGLIALLGFAVGVAWPRFFGIRLGPTAPGDSPSTAASRAPEAASGLPAAIVAPTPSATAVAPSGPPTVTVFRGTLLSCKSQDGEMIRGATACGHIGGFDAIAHPRIRRLSSCSASDGATGKFTATFAVDFSKSMVTIDIGKSSTVPNAESIGGCLKQQFFGAVDLSAIEHVHPRYWIQYNANFAIGDSVGAPTQPSVGTPRPSTPAPSTPADAPVASVAWEIAIVRDTPRTGQVVARLQRGTKIRVGGAQEGWYRIRYGSDFSSEGWVYRGAIAK